jgi:RNA-dependent RNA polymerase
MLLANFPDIKRNGYCFTDGVGYISPRLAQLISQDHFGLGYVCSAFQIRIGGAKGVLMVN